jgi:hypothetical protein
VDRAGFEPAASAYDSIGYPIETELDDILDSLYSKEVKAFVQKIKDKVIQHHIDKAVSISLDLDELEIVHKIYDEAKMMLEKAYRKTFHKLTSEDWHLTIIDGNRQVREHDRLRYKLP